MLVKALVSRKGDGAMGKKGPSLQVRATRSASASEQRRTTTACERTSTRGRGSEVYSKSCLILQPGFGFGCLSPDDSTERDFGRDKK